MASLFLGDWNIPRAERLKERLCPSFSVRMIRSGSVLLALARQDRPSVVILPLRWTFSESASPLEHCLGFKLVQKLACINPRPSVILFDEHLHRHVPSEYCRPFFSRVKAFLDESAPLFETVLAAKALECFQRRESPVGKPGDETCQDLGLIGDSMAMSNIRKFVTKAVRISDVPVLISGESGTGKEVVARAIHSLDRKRQTGPFIAVNCSAVSEALFESAFFGHKKGAYTGASSERPGYFRAAEKGVLFLDEISELSLSLQPKLLRVLQENCVLPVGDACEQAVDARVIFGTNRDLLAEVSRGRFRADLYHRINIFSLNIPALRFHREDIEALVYFFLRRHRQCYDRPILEVESAVLDLLNTLDFQGNVRELENLVRKILFRKSFGDTIEMSDLPPEIFQEVLKPSLLKACRGLEDFLLEQLREGFSCREILDACEETLLKKALQKTDGSRTRMASLLKISPRTLFNKLHKHRL